MTDASEPTERSGRPGRLVAVVGTATEVGKTWVSCELLAALRAGRTSVAARKPAQSYEEGDPVTDADLLAEVTGEDPTTVCPSHRWYPIPMAPPMAADALGRAEVLAADLAAEIVWKPGTRFGLVETAGGVASPLAHDTDSARFVGSLVPDVVVLVADAGLGTINGVLSCLGVLRAAGVERVLVHLNRFDAGSDLHRRNLAWLVEREGLDVTFEMALLVDRMRQDPMP